MKVLRLKSDPGHTAALCYRWSSTVCLTFRRRAKMAEPIEMHRLYCSGQGDAEKTGQSAFG